MTYLLTGLGALNLSSPTGGSAKGIPHQTSTSRPLSALWRTPRMRPVVVSSTRSSAPPRRAPLPLPLLPAPPAPARTRSSNSSSSSRVEKDMVGSCCFYVCVNEHSLCLFVCLNIYYALCNTVITVSESSVAVGRSTLIFWQGKHCWLPLLLLLLLLLDPPLTKSEGGGGNTCVVL